MDLLEAYKELDVEPGKTFFIDRLTCKDKEGKGMTCSIQRDGKDVEVKLQKISVTPNFNMCSIGKNGEKDDYIACI